MPPPCTYYFFSDRRSSSLGVVAVGHVREAPLERVAVGQVLALMLVEARHLVRVDAVVELALRLAGPQERVGRVEALAARRFHGCRLRRVVALVQRVRVVIAAAVAVKRRETPWRLICVSC